jgi:LmbE family N-acetylglucosaminyl deacetylase
VKRLHLIFLFATWIATLLPRATAQFPPAPGTGPGLAETLEAIDSARVTTRILYITAHPDDESAAVLTYLARGLHADVALLSITRGEGGQNALGPEQAPQLGLIRTQELLAATRGYGVKLYFTRAPDFGFSKTPEETEKIWGDQVLEDMVRVIRTFRPNIVINGWGGVHAGHGHHQAAGLLTPKAALLAADRSFCAECGADWKVEQILDLERSSDNPSGYVLPLDDVSPLWGKTWREIGLDAFVSHRTQGISGFINSPFLRRPIALKREDGAKLDPATLARPLIVVLGEEHGRTCKSHPDWCSKVKAADEGIAKARAVGLQMNWPAATELLSQASESISSLYRADIISSRGPLAVEEEQNVREAVERVAHALLLAAGFEFTAEADRSEVVLGEPVTVTVRYGCRPGVKCPVYESTPAWPTLYLTGKENDAPGVGDPVKGLRYTITLHPPHEKPYTWQKLRPEPNPAAVASLRIKVGEGKGTEITVPVFHIAATSTQVDRVPLRIVPAYALAVEPKQAIEVLSKKRNPFDVLLKVHPYATQPGRVSVGLDVPLGWTSTKPVTIEFSGTGDQYAKLTVSPPDKLAQGNYTLAAYVKRGDEKFTTSLEPLPSMPTLLWEEPAQCVVHAFEINVPENLRVGYITAEGEPIPEALQRLGIQVETLDAQALAFGDLSKYDAIVVGVRAYELRPELPGANQRLLDYVSSGGTLLVQYNRDSIWDKLQPGPYPAKIGNPTPRITDENSAVKFLKPDDPRLNRPNKITQDDFKGWVQERGLYFWSQFDPKYTPLLAMNDPGESDLNGGLVYAHYGKGTYIYTGIAFFRQLPEGVPGAYRLFVNLLSASRGH